MRKSALLNFWKTCSDKEQTTRSQRTVLSISKEKYPNKMKALQCFAKEGSLTLENIPIPSITNADDVLIKVGLCVLDQNV